MPQHPCLEHVDLKHFEGCRRQLIHKLNDFEVCVPDHILDIYSSEEGAEK
jgi:hypothetical protein